MTALSIVQTACSWILPASIPQALFSATDAQTIQLRALLNEAGTELVTWPLHDWTKLMKETSFSTVATNVQPGAVPSDFGKFCDDSMWDRTTDRPLWGPISPQQWQQELAGPTFTTMYYAFRIRGADFLMTPVPVVGDQIFYEYVSNQYVFSAAGSPTAPNQSAFQADGDTSIFDETLMARGLRWCFLRAKGLDYAQEYQTWVEMAQKLAARDGGMPKLSASRNYPWTRRSPFTPDGNFPGP